MAAKYEFDFQRFEVESLYGKIDQKELITLGERFLVDHLKPADTNNPNEIVWQSQEFNAVKDLTDTAKRQTLSLNQLNYLTRLVQEYIPERIKYEADFKTWYAARPDIQEIYKWAHKNSGHVYVMHPVHRTWCYKGDDSWNPDWEEAPHDSTMFWRMVGDWNVRKFIAVHRDTVFSEGDLVVLRFPFIGNWDYDPLWDRFNTPDKTTLRVGTVLEMTDNIHRNSRAGKGSRAINVLWNGTVEAKLLPERVIKLYERKRRSKKA